ncbi:insulin-like growth factor-binding protein-related protein 1 [Homarus americanus]|uniref:insulin-like growth factor-binding protein-related protein 1 n=1 Tax=Homarus americanus TaxID=6706 RepID=UPI001C44719D|nr:insulin-like growth factor-binding protein-related protein 1 [Homarus americanus]
MGTRATGVTKDMAKGVILSVTAAFLVAVAVAQDIDISCGECDRSLCPEVEDSCLGGLLLDTCGCCQVCARGLGQLCENQTLNIPSPSQYGICGEYLVCLTRTDTGNTGEATCQCEDDGVVCGSDGVTYTTLCHLLQDTTEKPDLHVAVRGPCEATPIIKSRSEDKIRPLGSILVLDCEAFGYPVPEITWELNRPDGSSVKLPGDDASFAVQVRGGPEPYMVTGWVQIMRVTKESLGIYTCVATNTEGEVRASTTVSEEKHGEKEATVQEL